MRLHEAAPKLIIQERVGDKVKVSSYWPVPELTRAESALGRLHILCLLIHNYPSDTSKRSFLHYQHLLSTPNMSISPQTPHPFQTRYEITPNSIPSLKVPLVQLMAPTSTAAPLLLNGSLHGTRKVVLRKTA